MNPNYHQHIHPTKKGYLFSNQRFIKKLSVRNSLKLSSSICAVLGGSLLASNIAMSGYGFLLLSLSSSQLLTASLLEKDASMTLYAGSVFLFVDCFGIYRWILN
ncbi:MAG: hypothetical protein AAFV72_24490 [Cyanobacteria bacterium J06635_1]